MCDQLIVHVINPEVAAAVRSVAQLLHTGNRLCLCFVLRQTSVLVHIVGTLHLAACELRRNADHVVIVGVQHRTELFLRVAVTHIRHDEQQCDNEHRQCDHRCHQRQHEFTSQRFHFCSPLSHVYSILPFACYGKNPLFIKLSFSV